MLAKIKFGRYTRKNETNNPISVAYITGADMLIAKQQFKNVEGFSSDFFMYYEETELSFRLNKIGLKSINVPTAQIIHLEGKSFDVNEKKLSMFFQGRKIFY